MQRFQYKITLTLVWTIVSCRQPVTIDPDAGPLPPEPQVEEREVARGSAGELGELDVLFVIDNSGSMRDEQDALAKAMPSFLDTLRSEAGELPDLHVGVITTDLGAGPYGIDSCSENGDNGNLQVGTGCFLSGTEPYLIDRPDGSGSRKGNYEGSLDEAMGCLARQGVNGCGFEQPLEAIERALDENPPNGGFLRSGADLAIVILTDEDDCSAQDVAVFDSSQDTLDTPLGPLSSFRCFEFGVVCEPDDPRGPGQKSGCQPRDDSPYLSKVSDTVGFLRQLKERQRIAVSLIAGNMGPVNVAIETDPMNGNQEAFVQPSCVSSAGEADPPTRLGAFTASFELRSTASICEEGYPMALGEVADDLRNAPRCLSGNLADRDPDRDGVQPRCRVEEIAPDGKTADLPTCAGTSERPCFRVIRDSSCDGGYLVQFQRDAPAESGTEIAVHCDVYVE